MMTSLKYIGKENWKKKKRYWLQIPSLVRNSSSIVTQKEWNKLNTKLKLSITSGNYWD